MRVLVTGGAGFIGSKLVAALLKDPKVLHVRAVDRRSMHFFGPSERLRIIQGDLCDARLMRKALAGIDLIYHLAAMSSVLAAQCEPSACLRDGEALVLNLLESARKTKPRKIVFTSSCAIYGATPSSVLSEDLLPHPCSAYGASKLACEAYFKSYAHSYDMDSVILRFFNVYGPPIHPHVRSNSVVNLFCEQALKNAATSIRGSGNQTRDYIFVDDAISALQAAGSMARKCAGPINIGTGHATSVQDIVDMIELVHGKPIKREHLPVNSSEAMHAKADLHHARTFLQFNPCVSIKLGVARTLKWYDHSCTYETATQDTFAGYGKCSFGSKPFGGSRKASDGRTLVPRQVSRTGQLSYRGRLYSLGNEYRGRKALVLERGSRLIVSMDGVPPIELILRQ